MGERIEGETLAMAYANGRLEAIKRVHGSPSLWYWIYFFGLKENVGLFGGLGA